jgi:MOSC domain-containing protein YiiM
MVIAGRAPLSLDGMPGRVAAIQLCPGHRQPMYGVKTARLEAGLGLRGDKHAGESAMRQVLIADKEALDALDLEPGTIKENVTVEGLDVMILQPGARVRIGGQAVLEITSVCKPCFRMDEIRAGLRAELEGRRGMLARVVQGGEIAVGDPAVVVSAQAKTA